MLDSSEMHPDNYDVRINSSASDCCVDNTHICEQNKVPEAMRSH